jgi:hypothetical protein
MGDWSRLGNQMFQYAVAHLAAMDKDAVVSLPFDKVERRRSITLPLAFKKVIHEPLNGALTQTVKEEKEFSVVSFLTNKEKLSGNTEVKGYYQNADYFKGREALVLDLFEFQPTIKMEADRFVRGIKAKGFTPVSIHIRMKDCANDPSEFLYTLWNDIALSTAVDKISPGVNNPYYLIHSSDFAQCKRHFYIFFCSLGEFEFVEKSEALSLAIMAECDYHVISASTYSWWGAWMADQRNKALKKRAKVIIPRPWFNPKIDRVKNNELVRSIL